MADEERQSRETEEQPDASSKTTAPSKQTAQSQGQESSVPSTEDERTGEGTGARAGEYS